MDRELKEILGRLRAKAEEKRDRAKAAADAEFLADVQSIQRLTSLGSDGSAPLAPVPQLSSNSSVRHLSTADEIKRVGGRKNGPTASVRIAIGTLGDGFSVATISEFLERESSNTPVSRAAIYSALNKLTESGEIERMKTSDGDKAKGYRIVKLKRIL